MLQEQQRSVDSGAAGVAVPGRAMPTIPRRSRARALGTAAGGLGEEEALRRGRGRCSGGPGVRRGRRRYR